jgi:hypothetical protein
LNFAYTVLEAENRESERYEYNDLGRDLKNLIVKFERVAWHI